MWLFTGRYAHLGAAICLIALVVASVGLVFITTAVRLIQRRDLKVPSIVNVLLVAIPASLFGYAVGCGEPVFVSDHLNLGMALFVAVAGIVLGLLGVTLSNRLRPLRVLVLFVASGMIFGDLTGWILRSAAPSKYTSSVGSVYPGHLGIDLGVLGNWLGKWNRSGVVSGTGVYLHLHPGEPFASCNCTPWYPSNETHRSLLLYSENRNQKE